MAALARPIMMMLYGNNDSLALAAGIMQSGALLTVLLALSTLTTGIYRDLVRCRHRLCMQRQRGDPSWIFSSVCCKV